jgi:succinate dehydrogenase hydrophobic anchor subunit
MSPRFLDYFHHEPDGNSGLPRGAVSLALTLFSLTCATVVCLWRADTGPGWPPLWIAVAVTTSLVSGVLGSLALIVSATRPETDRDALLPALVVAALFWCIVGFVVTWVFTVPAG